MLKLFHLTAAHAPGALIAEPYLDREQLVIRVEALLAGF
jgi:hypothetical protein